MAINQKKVLEGLAGEGIQVLSVTNLSSFMAASLVSVDADVRYKRGLISLSRCGNASKFFAFDADALDDMGREFYNERFTKGHMAFIPAHMAAKLDAVVKRFRRSIESRAIQGNFILMSDYNELKADSQKTRQEFFQLRDSILGEWPLLLASFESGAKELIAGLSLPEEQQGALLASLMAQVPRESAYRDSFQMELRVHVFPSQPGTMDGLASSVALDVKRTWSDETVQIALGAIEQQVGTCWAKLNKAMTQFLDKGTISGATISSLLRCGKDTAHKNLFRNPLLKDLAQEMQRLDNRDIDKQAEIVESCIADVYAYAKEARLDLSYDECPYTLAQLEAIAGLSLNQLRLEV